MNYAILALAWTAYRALHSAMISVTATGFLTRVPLLPGVLQRGRGGHAHPGPLVRALSSAGADHPLGGCQAHPQVPARRVWHDDQGHWATGWLENLGVVEDLLVPRDRDGHVTVRALSDSIPCWKWRFDAPSAALSPSSPV